MKIGWKEILVLITFSLAYICLLVKFAHAVDPNCIRQQFDGIDYALYKTTDSKIVVWTDAEKTTLIAQHNKELTDIKFSTNSTAWFWTDADFMPCSATRDADIALMTMTFNLSLRANDWFVLTFRKGDKPGEGVVSFLNDPLHDPKTTGVVAINGYYNKLAVQAIP